MQKKKRQRAKARKRQTILSTPAKGACQFCIILTLAFIKFTVLKVDTTAKSGHNEVMWFMHAMSWHIFWESMGTQAFFYMFQIFERLGGAGNFTELIKKNIFFLANLVLTREVFCCFDLSACRPLATKQQGDRWDSTGHNCALLVYIFLHILKCDCLWQLQRYRGLPTQIEEGLRQLRSITSGMVCNVMCTVPDVRGQGDRYKEGSPGG